MADAPGEPDPRDEWRFGGRWYQPTFASSGHPRDGFALEVEDVAPAPGRGLVFEVFRDDVSGDVAFTAFTTDPLPFALVEKAVAVARDELL
ncbi:MAG TPA: hypothetical protein VNA20_05440 [Frankiaceae bacterium]|nr:hypothetical protein [Frankiaceae bacterium]